MSTAMPNESSNSDESLGSLCHPKTKKSKNLDILEFSSSMKPISTLNPLDANMANASAEVTPEVSSTLQKPELIPTAFIPDAASPRITTSPSKTANANEVGDAKRESGSSLQQSIASKLVIEDKNEKQNASRDEKIVEKEEAKDEDDPVGFNFGTDDDKCGDAEPVDSDAEEDDTSYFDIIKSWNSGTSQSCKTSEVGLDKIPKLNVELVKAMKKFNSMAFHDDFSSLIFEKEFKEELREAVDKLLELEQFMSPEEKQAKDSFIILFNLIDPIGERTSKFKEAIQNIDIDTQEDRSKLEAEQQKYTDLKSAYSKVIKPSINCLEKEKLDLDKKLKVIHARLNDIDKEKERLLLSKSENTKQQKESLARAKELSKSLKEPLQMRLTIEKELAQSYSELKHLLDQHVQMKLTRKF